MTPQQELDAIRAALESPAAQEWGEGDRWGITLSECDWTAEKIMIKEQEAHGLKVVKPQMDLFEVSL